MGAGATAMAAGAWTTGAGATGAWTTGAGVTVAGVTVTGATVAWARSDARGTGRPPDLELGSGIPIIVGTAEKETAFGKPQWLQ